MSELTKKNAQATQKNLEAAKVYVQEAERTAQGTGDKTLIQKVSKISKDITETATEISQRLKES